MCCAARAFDLTQNENNNNRILFACVSRDWEAVIEFSDGVRNGSQYSMDLMQLSCKIIPINNLIVNSEWTPVETDATFIHVFFADVGASFDSTELVDVREGDSIGGNRQQYGRRWMVSGLLRGVLAPLTEHGGACNM